jgi:hypothetical protein
MIKWKGERVEVLRRRDHGGEGVVCLKSGKLGFKELARYAEGVVLLQMKPSRCGAEYGLGDIPPLVGVVSSPANFNLLSPSCVELGMWRMATGAYLQLKIVTGLDILDI